MKKRELLKSIIFIAIFLFLLRSVSYMLRVSGHDKDRFSGFYAEEKNTIDVIIIGSSRVYPCYAAPRMYGEYGISAYPLSTSVQRPAAMIWLTKEALKRQSPVVFVYDVHMMLLPETVQMENMAYTRAVTDNLQYSVNRMNTIRSLVPDDEDLLSYYFDIFKYHSNWKSLILPSQWRSFRYQAPSLLKGNVLLDQVGRSLMPEVDAITEREAVSEEQEQYLRELLSFLQEQGQEAVFMITAGSCTEDEMKKLNYIEDVVSEYGYPFLNMNLYYEEIGIDFDTDYNDEGNHVNALGAKKITDFFSEWLKARFELDDYRNNSQYASWEEAYAIWAEEYDAAKKRIEQRIENGDYYTDEE